MGHELQQKQAYITSTQHCQAALPCAFMSEFKNFTMKVIAVVFVCLFVFGTTLAPFGPLRESSLEKQWPLWH